MYSDTFLESRTQGSSPENMMIKSSKAHQDALLETLGKSSMEAKSVSRYHSSTPKFIQKIIPNISSYSRIRHLVRTSNESFDNSNDISLLNVRGLLQSIKSLFSNEGFRSIIAILDLVADLFFCILYLYDIEYALNNLDDPELSNLPGPSYFWISRLPVTFSACVVFSFYILFSWCINVALADNRMRAVFSLLTLVNILSSIPFIVSVQIRVARYLYIPYFLRSIVGVGRLRKVLRLRATKVFINLSAVMEKVIILSAALLSIIYVGLSLFQYFEYRFGDRKLGIFESFYFVIVTLSTVGYGDISPSTNAGRGVVIFLIIAALTVLPSLISELLNSIAEGRDGKGGTYRRGNAEYFVVVGNFNNPIKLTDALDGLLHEVRIILSFDGDFKSPKHSTTEKVVVLGRSPAKTFIRSVLSNYKYDNRVTYLVGSGMDSRDLRRAQVKHASAVFILADRDASDHRREDEQNTLRAWAIYNYAPDVPLFVKNMLPDSESYQDTTVDASLCVEDLKQIILGLTLVYEGASTFLINLLNISSPESKYNTIWEEQYGDGFGNELFVAPLNPEFVGMLFNEASWLTFHEFQLNMIGVRTRDSYARTVILNPGCTYRLREGDEVLFIGQSRDDIELYMNLSVNKLKSQTTKKLWDSTISSVSHETAIELEELEYSVASKTNGASIIRLETERRRRQSNSLNQQTYFDVPSAPYDDSTVPECRLICGAPPKFDDILLESARDMSGHILVCTGDFDIFKFVCGLRASHLDSHHRILFLSHRKPTNEEFRILSVFPDINYMVGDPRQKKVLLDAGLNRCSKVAIIKMGTYSSNEFAGSESIMISHLIHHMCKRHEIDNQKTVIVEVTRRSHIAFLPPCPTTSSNLSYKKRFRNVMKNMSYSANSKQKGTLSKRFGKISELNDNQKMRGDFLRPEEAKIVGDAKFIYTPIFAAGRVVAAPMLDSLIFQLHKSPLLVEITLLLCGVERYRSGELPIGVSKSWISRIPISPSFVGRTYGEMYFEMAKEGIIPMGIYRQVDVEMSNKLPFVYTNPLPGVLLKTSDFVFVLAPRMAE